MDSISTRNQIIKFGLYTAFFTVSFSLMQFFLGTHYENDTISALVGFLILFVGIAVCAYDFKKQHGGFINLKFVLKLGTGISVINALVFILYFLLLTNVIEPNFWETAWQLAYEKSIYENPEQMTNPETGEFWTKEEFIGYLEWTKNLVYPFTIITNLFVGFMFSLLLGIFIKKGPKPDTLNTISDSEEPLKSGNVYWIAAGYVLSLPIIIFPLLEEIRIVNGLIGIAIGANYWQPHSRIKKWDNSTRKHGKRMSIIGAITFILMRVFFN